MIDTQPLRRILATCAAALCVASQAAVPAAPATPAAPGSVPAPAQAPVRTRESFDAGWRFHLGDVADGQAPDLPDSSWQPVGLPHSFSIPYFQSSSFYVGEGWYRKPLVIDRLRKDRQTFLEFEAAFQVAEVFVNGVRLAVHRGGYTGFPVNLTSALHAGRNLIAVRVSNRWDPTLAPRAGEHVFSGGIYRDVWLVQTRDVHVPWTGTFVTTPNLSAARGQVAVRTEVHNDGDRDRVVTVLTDILDDKDVPVASLPAVRVAVPRGQTVTAHQLSAPIEKPRLWSPETPVLYHASTRLVVRGRVQDTFDTEFGFRWVSWTADKGFFLNGRHRYFRGANVHQDQAGWGDAVTNGAIDRDVALIKEAGFDFIRGSHYPHDPHFAEATDHLGLMFLSEAPFWGTAGFKNPWASSAYPTHRSHWVAFDASVKRQLAEMIRINRNHPSIVLWGMCNEPFFSWGDTLPQVRRLLKEEVALAHRLDPTRAASVDGVQRGDLDRIGDVAAYNGDGAALFPNPGIPNFVSEYGSTEEDRPGTYAPGWGDLERTPGATAGKPESWRAPWRSGEVLWAGFDHGSIAGRKFGSMGMIDYARLPKRQWYWYRNAYRGIAPPPWPRPGAPAGLRLSSSAPAIRRADGTDDVQVVVTVVDAQGHAISDSPPVHLQIEAGPGELPTGRAIDFAPDSDIPIRDGQAAIAMRSWQAGVSRLRATSPGLKDATLEVRTLEGPPFEPGVTPLAPDRPYRPQGPVVTDPATDLSFGTDNPTDASSSAAGHSSRLVNDGDADTFWVPAADDARPWVLIDPERILTVDRLVVTLRAPGRYAFHAEIQRADGTWATLVDVPMRDAHDTVVELPVPPTTGEKVRLSARAASGEPVGIAEMRVGGHLSNP